MRDDSIFDSNKYSDRFGHDFQRNLKLLNKDC